jgi:hypothetical protein
MKLTALVFVPLSCLLAGELTVKSDLAADGIRFQLSTGKMPKDDFLRKALVLLEPKSIRLGVIVNYPSDADRLLAGPRLEFHCTYEEWLAKVSESRVQQGECPVVQEAMKVGASIVYRSIDKKCSIDHLLLQGGSDPLLLRIGNSQIEILSMDFGEPAKADRKQRAQFRLYAWADRRSVTEALARALTAKMKAMAGGLDVSVRLRSDAWFLADCGFPLLYGFGKREGVPPTKEQFLHTRTVFCSAFDPWPVGCFVTE